MPSDQGKADSDFQKLPLIAAKESQEFMSALILALIEEIDRRRERHIPAENVQIFNHGRGWTFQREDADGFSPKTGELQLHRTERTISIVRILKQDVTQIVVFLRDTAQQFEDGMLQRLFNEVESIVEETGNTVNIPKDGSLKEAIKNMVANTHLSVNADGSISRPTLYLNPTTLHRIQQEQREISTEHDNEIEGLLNLKEDEARQRESERLARYQRPK